MGRKKIARDNGIMENYTLTDLVSVQKLQDIQDAFADANQIAATIVDIDGKPITRPSNHSEVCVLIRATELGLANCIRSGKDLGLRAAATMKPFSQKCLSCGFTDAAAPIVVNGRHIANWLIGQNCVNDVDEQRIIEYSLEIGADANGMVNAFRVMNKIPRDRFEKILAFLWIMANEISNMGYQNLLQKKQTLALERIQQQLQKHKTDLEKMVADRTRVLNQTNQNLSEEIALKTRIEKKQGRLLAAIENAAETIIITDAGANIIFANAALEKVSGYAPQEVIGKNPRVLQSGYHDKTFYREFWETILNGRVWEGRFINKRKDGEVFQEDCTVSSVKDANGKIVNFVAVKRDITKELELEKQLQQARRLESIGTLAAGLAHEINTPIQYIRDNTKFLQEALVDFFAVQKLHQDLIDAAGKQQLLNAQREAIQKKAREIDLDFLAEETTQAAKAALTGLDRISSIVVAMKEFSHSGGSEKHREDLNKIVMNTLTVTRSQWQNYADIDLNLQQNLPPVPLLSGKFKQVLLNLILNAAQAITEKIGEQASEKGKISIATSLEHTTICLKVGDTGIGISKDVIGKIFDPFFTTKGVGKGSGQGLAIARNIIIDSHGGSIDVVSEPGGGTEFFIRLPLE